MAKNRFTKDWWLYFKRGLVSGFVGAMFLIALAMIITAIGLAIPVLGVFVDVVLILIFLPIDGWIMTKTVEDWIPN